MPKQYLAEISVCKITKVTSYTPNAKKLNLWFVGDGCSTLVKNSVDHLGNADSAFTIIGNTVVNGYHSITSNSQSGTSVPQRPLGEYSYCLHTIVKAVGTGVPYIRLAGGSITNSSQSSAVCNLSTGVMALSGGSTSKNVSYYSVDLGSGWWQFVISFTSEFSSHNTYCTVEMLNNLQYSQYTGDGLSGILIEYVQLETGSTPSSTIVDTGYVIDGLCPKTEYSYSYPTLYYCTGPGYISSPTDSPANTTYLPRLKSPGSLKKSMFSAGKIGGVSEMSYGDLILTNVDGNLDAYATNYAFDGRSLVIKQAVNGVQSTLFTGTIDKVLFNYNSVSVKIRDKQLLFQNPIQPLKYLGNNVLPAGIEGTAELLGKPKPLVYGKVYNITPVCVNTSMMVYQVSTVALNDIPKVYDRGVALAKSTNFASSAIMLSQIEQIQNGNFSSGANWNLGAGWSISGNKLNCSAGNVNSIVNQSTTLTIGLAYTVRITGVNRTSSDGSLTIKIGTSVVGVLGNLGYINCSFVAASSNFSIYTDGLWVGSITQVSILQSPVPGTYWTCFNEGLFMLGAYPAGVVTCDAVQGGSAAARTVAQLMCSILSPAFIPSSDIISYSVTMADLANSSEVGIYVSEETTIGNVLDELASSINLWYNFNSSGKLDMRVFTEAFELPAITLDMSTILSIDKSLANDSGKGFPIKLSKLNYAKNYTVMTSELSDSVDTNRRSVLGRNYSTVSNSDSTVTNSHLLAETAEFNTLLINSVDASAENKRRLALFSIDRYRYLIKSKLGALKFTYNGFWDDSLMSELPTTYNVNNAAFALCNGKLYVFGGQLVSNGSNVHYTQYIDINNLTGTWSGPQPYMPSPTNGDVRWASAMGAVTVDNYVYIGGGINGAGLILDVIRLNVDTMTWDNTVSKLPAKLQYPSFIYDGTYIYRIGGWGQSGGVFTIDRLSASAPTSGWQSGVVSNAPESRTGCGGCCYNGYMYVFGGTVSTLAVASCKRLNLASPLGAWDDAGVTDLPIALANPKVSLDSVTGYVYIWGGGTNTMNTSNWFVFRLNLNNPTSTWEIMCPLPSDSLGDSRIIAYNNRVYAITYYNYPLNAPKMTVLRTDMSPLDTAAVYDLNQVYAVNLPNRPNLVVGNKRLISTEINYDNDDITLELWG